MQLSTLSQPPFYLAAVPSDIRKAHFICADLVPKLLIRGNLIQPALYQKAFLPAHPDYIV